MLTRRQVERKGRHYRMCLVMKPTAYRSVCRLGSLDLSSLELPKWRSLAKPQTDVVYSWNLPGMLSFGELCLGFIMSKGLYTELFLDLENLVLHAHMNVSDLSSTWP